MQLYGVAASRTRRALWALEEAGAGFSFNKLDMRAGEHRQPAYLAINPNGTVPALVDGDLTLFESGAICCHIARRYPQSGLLPAEPDDEVRCLQWLFWVVGDLEQPLWTLAKHKFVLPEAQRLAGMREVAAFEWQRPSGVLASHLDGREFMVGDRFSLADIFVAHTLNWARSAKITLGGAHLDAYLERMLARPAYQRTERY